MIFGLDLKRGDEVIVTTQNYPRMLNAWEQRARRDGIVVKHGDASTRRRRPRRTSSSSSRPRSRRARASIEVHAHHQPHRPDPARCARSCELARPRGIEVFVDGAHAFAHFPFTRDELGCDYYGTSLHKWLLAPIGTGFLYVRRRSSGRSGRSWRRRRSMDADIRKYEEIGTHPAANHNAIAAALAFHRAHRRGAEGRRGCAACATAGRSGCWPRAAAACGSSPRSTRPLGGGIGFVSHRRPRPCRSWAAGCMRKHRIVTDAHHARRVHAASASRPTSTPRSTRSTASPSSCCARCGAASRESRVRSA